MDKVNTKKKTVEPKGKSNHNIQDKGYKKLFKNKEMFLEFLQTFIHEDWVKDINENDLMLIDKEYILQDYRKKESDIVYRMKLKSKLNLNKRFLNLCFSIFESGFSVCLIFVGDSLYF